MNYQKFVDDFIQKTGIDLKQRLNNGEYDTIQLNSFIDECGELVLYYIKANNPMYNEDHLEDLQVDAIWDAMLDQAHYLVKNQNYDLTMSMGINPTTGQMLDIREMEKRYLAPRSRMKLMNAGLLYRGITSGRYSKYLEERMYWR